MENYIFSVYPIDIALCRFNMFISRSDGHNGMCIEINIGVQGKALLVVHVGDSEALQLSIYTGLSFRYYASTI